MQKDYILASLGVDPWHFIFGVKGKNESFEETIQREVRKETGIQLKTIEFLSCLDNDNEKKYFYHTHLTDDNVNDIVRQDGKILGFFSVKELNSLSLSIVTKLLLKRHQHVLEKVEEV